MEITQLESFLAVARELHFARAAEKLGISQPQLSRRICNLEKDLGTDLFYRGNKWHVALTQAGKLLLPEAELILRKIGQMTQGVRAAGEGSAGTLSIGTISSLLGHRPFLQTLQEMHFRYPALKLEITDSGTNELPGLLKTGKCDMIFLRAPGMADTDTPVVTETVFSDHPVIALPRKHKLAGKKRLFLKELAGEEFVLISSQKASSYRSFITRICRERGGFEPEVGYEVSSSYSALHLAASGLGATIISSAYCGLFGGELAYIEIADKLPDLPIVAQYSTENTLPAVNLFLDVLYRHFSA